MGGMAEVKITVEAEVIKAADIKAAEDARLEGSEKQT